MTVPVLVQHDRGCKWGRFEGVVDEEGNILSGEITPAHTDDAKRLMDGFNLHKSAEGIIGYTGWIAVRYQDGAVSFDVYESRSDAVADAFPWDREFFYLNMRGPSMTICSAASVLRYKREMSRMDRPHTDRDAPGGGLEVIRRLTVEDNEKQIAAVRSGRNVAVPMGIRKG